ncbi:SDR family oxidoreductase [Microbispora sp. CA-135349]|uniref:SDR family oxidoreductase n=1 Tax=Microbispora sp. CA-135349 TaxID=3239953 RepID=UPI003D947519
MEPVTLITGGSTGIGAETARRLLKRGHRVTATARRAERLAGFARSAGAGADRLLTVAGDTADAGHVRQAVDLTMETFGRLDNVVVNAGFSLPGTLADHSPENMRSMVLTNVLGPALVVQAVGARHGGHPLLGTTAAAAPAPRS